MPSQIDKKILALRLPVWRVTQVQAFLGCGKQRAYSEIAKCALRFGKVANHEVKRDDFLKHMGTDYKTEIQNAYYEKEAEARAKAEYEIKLEQGVKNAN